MVQKDKQERTTTLNPIRAVASFVFFAAAMLYALSNFPPDSTPLIALSDFVGRVGKDDVRSVKLNESEASGKFANGDRFWTQSPDIRTLLSDPAVVPFKLHAKKSGPAHADQC